MRERHNAPGSHFNVFTPDQQSAHTGRGAHNRLLVMGGTGDERRTITVREDYIPGRDYPTPVTLELVSKFARNPRERMHPRGAALTFVGVSDWWAPTTVAWQSREWTFSF